MFKKNVAVTGFPFCLVGSADGAAIISGTVTGYVTKDGGTQATIAGTAVHEGNGQWSIDLASGEMNGDVVGLLFTHASAVPVHFAIRTTTKLVSELVDAAAAPTAVQVRTEMDSNSTKLAFLTGDAFARIGATGSGLTSLASQASVNTIDDLLDTEVAAIKADTAAIKLQTDNLVFTTAGRVDASATLDADDVTGNLPAQVNAAGPGVGVLTETVSLAQIGAAPWEDSLGVAVQAILAASKAILDALEARLPAIPAAVGSEMTLADGAITAPKIGTDAITGPKVSADAVTKIQAGLATSAEGGEDLTIDGTVDATGLGSGSFRGDSALSASDDFYNGMRLVFTSGALQGLNREVTDYTGSTRTFTFESVFPSSPAAGAAFSLLGGAG